MQSSTGGVNEGLGLMARNIYFSMTLSSLSFHEYLRIKELQRPEAFDWPAGLLLKIQELARPYVGHFHEYLVRGGFPQTAQVEGITQVQRLLRKDIIGEALKRDMTALFGVRRNLDHTFCISACTMAGSAICPLSEAI